MKYITGIIIIMLVSTRVYGELTAMEIDEIRAVYRANQVKMVSDALRASDSLTDWPSGMPPLANLMEHETSDSRSFRWNISSEVYKHAKEIDEATEKKRELVYLLTTRLNDRSASIRGSVLNWLSGFSTSSFNEAARQNIMEKFDETMSKDTILLMGIVDPEYCMKKIRHLVEDVDLYEETAGRFWGRPAWAALLVHARYGNSTSVVRVLDALEHEPSENIRVVRLFEDLGYVRQPKVVEYLKQQVFDDRVIPAGSDYFAISYAQKACMVLSTMLKNFPKKAGRRYTSAEMERCKAWLSQQETWEFVE